MTRFMSSASIKRPEAGEVKRLKASRDLLCPVCGNGHWRPGGVDECVGCQLRRVMARRRQRVLDRLPAPTEDRVLADYWEGGAAHGNA